MAEGVNNTVFSTTTLASLVQTQQRFGENHTGVGGTSFLRNVGTFIQSYTVARLRVFFTYISKKMEVCVP